MQALVGADEFIGLRNQRAAETVRVEFRIHILDAVKDMLHKLLLRLDEVKPRAPGLGLPKHRRPDDSGRPVRDEIWHQVMEIHGLMMRVQVLQFVKGLSYDEWRQYVVDNRSQHGSDRGIPKQEPVDPGKTPEYGQGFQVRGSKFAGFHDTLPPAARLGLDW